ncbi:hypothetical protein BCh11DRAFT_06595 [Burkholderia sp. Ch1-1]|uniref:Uncharacterized protein n=1 Tax=Paraburkholderia dioscoreae TaxID=2604047 RepID=A0A5Q4ZDP3_9BURK|nr:MULTISPECIES: hypothetical protein [Paraburkholderia]EIF31079.1 hypothetical protein BCh11DRAFT_06595 [Burkholderia sp. Ch1-1]MDR8401114.1 hypothetical protein [Paraburkholderia sp. USG1]VVD28730.1 conserved protein of unknown function [Paraburkholderia dioscoreae]
MKPVTVDMLRAHLLVASLTAMGTEVLVCLGLLLLPVSQHAFNSTPFRLLAIAVIVSGVIVTRQFAHAAFELAREGHYATGAGRPARPFAIASNCPRRWLVILHLRLTGRPFVLAER